MEGDHVLTVKPSLLMVKECNGLFKQSLYSFLPLQLQKISDGDPKELQSFRERPSSL